MSVPVAVAMLVCRICHKNFNGTGARLWLSEDRVHDRVDDEICLITLLFGRNRWVLGRAYITARAG